MERSPHQPRADPVIVYGGDDSFTRQGVRVGSWRGFATDPLAGLTGEAGQR